MIYSPKTKSGNDARQGENSGRMPIVLAMSVLLVIMLFAGVSFYSRRDANKHIQAVQSEGAK